MSKEQAARKPILTIFVGKWRRLGRDCHVTGRARAGRRIRLAAWPRLLCRHRFRPEIIQHAIWLYLRFTLSYRDVEELLVAAWPGWTPRRFRLHRVSVNHRADRQGIRRAGARGGGGVDECG